MIITYICRLETALPATLSLIRYVRVLQYMLARGTFKMRLRSFEVGQKKKDWRGCSKLSTSWIRGSFIAINV